MGFAASCASASALHEPVASTPQQHQLLLGVAGYTGRAWATITELAEFLQERHNAVVGLVQRARPALRAGPPHPPRNHYAA
jgi:hypothetical protein